MDKQKYYDFLHGPQEDRVDTVLDMIGVETGDSSQHVKDILNSIMVFAKLKGDKTFELNCQQKLEHIRTGAAVPPDMFGKGN